MRQAAHRQSGATVVVVLLSVLITLVAMVGLGGAYLYFSGALSGNAEAAAGEEEARPSRPVAQYLSLEPELVVNFTHENRVRFLQVTLDAMAYDRQALEQVKAHMPMIRDRTLLLLSQQTYDALTSRSGKEGLRISLRDEINAVLDERVDEGTRIEDVYFTSFVIQ